MKIKIWGIPYTITRVSSHKLVDHGGDNTSLWGQISYVDHSIRIASAPKERELRSLLHEILHGLVQDGGLSTLKKKNGGHHEEMIDQLALGLAEVLESLGFSLPDETGTQDGEV